MNETIAPRTVTTSRIDIGQDVLALSIVGTKSTPAIKPHNNPTYLVIDTKTHAVLSTQKSRSHAEAKVDRLNATHGSYRYGVDIVW